MSNFEAVIYNWASNANLKMSGSYLIWLLIALGLYFTVITRFVQVRHFGESFRKTFGNVKLFGKKEKSGMSSFQALSTAIAAQIGTGNIVGCATAIIKGGPGAIFWMWILAFFGMATIYAEATCAIKTRKVDENGNIKGGPVYYITTAYKGKLGKILAIWFSVCAVLALGFAGCMVQSNSIGLNMQRAFGIPAWVVGLVLCALCAIVFLGGNQRLASVTEKVVPIMACIFLFGAITLLVIRAKYIPETFAIIFRYAFKPDAIIGGTWGWAIKKTMNMGANRGLFSNEAGMGSTPHAHALANVEKAHDQGVVAMFGVFLDTIVVLTINALVIINTLYAGNGILSSGVIPETITKENLAQIAFGTVYGETAGNMFVAICLLFFAFSTVLGWNLFGKVNVLYLFGKKHEKLCTVIYSVIAIGFVFLGTVFKNDTVWELTDFFNYIMVIPNAIGLFALGKVVKESLKEGEA